tara:strand:+ start:53 stop:466 length:414 start_codon:yes stop_codon:yes gene_type:complete
MQKLQLSLTILYLTISSPSFSYADWFKITEDKKAGITFYIDSKRLNFDDDYVYYWNLIDYLNPNANGGLSLIDYRMGECKLLRYKILNQTHYLGNMGVGQSVSNLEPDKNWTYAKPNSAPETILSIICQVASRTKNN